MMKLQVPVSNGFYKGKKAYYGTLPTKDIFLIPKKGNVHPDRRGDGGAEILYVKKGRSKFATITIVGHRGFEPVNEECSEIGLFIVDQADLSRKHCEYVSFSSSSKKPWQVIFVES